ncbi:MAG: cob(I)yrinic acid a,c-diamide adenosyltransferase [Promethearchaeota archaeon]
MLHYHYGDGPRKTTAAFGLIVRALGHGLKPYLVQFLKRDVPEGDVGFNYGECRTLEKLGVPVKQYGKPTFIMPGDPPDPGDKARSLEGLAHAAEVISEGRHDLVVLDEVVDAILLRHFTVSDVVEAVTSRPDHVEVVVTGRPRFDELVEVADYVTEFREVKHPYRRGVLAREGVEY